MLLDSVAHRRRNSAGASKTKVRPAPDAIALAAGAASAALGIAVMAGWHLGNPRLTQLYPGLTPMAYHSAAAFLALGLACGAVAFGRRWMARAAAAVAALLAFVRLLQYATGFPEGLESILLPILPPSPLLPPVTMAPNTAIGFVLAAAGILFRTGGRRHPAAIAFCGSAAAALGLSAFLGYCTGLPTYFWGHFTPMSLNASAGLITLGVALVVISWRQGTPGDRRAWASVVVAMAGGVTALSLWQALSTVETLHIEAAVPLRSSLPEVVLVFTLALATLLALTVYLAQTARMRTLAAERLRSEAERALQALSASERKYRTLLENLPQKIAYKDRNSVYLSCNENYARALGIAPEAIAGKTDYEFFPKELADKYRDDDRRVMGSGETAEIEEEYVIEGGRQYVQTVKTPVRNEAGAITGVIIIWWDVSARKRAEEELSRANAYNRSLIEASLDPLVTIAPDGKITDVNRATENITGCSREQLIGSDFCDYFTDPERARIGYQQVFREGSVQDYELEIRRHDGRLTPVVYNASLYRDESDAVAGVFAAARDITERKRAEHERGKAEELRGYLAAIVDSTEDAVIGKSLDGMILSWNTGAEKLYGYSAADATGKSISLLCPPGRAAEAFAILEKVGRGEIVEHHETERIRKDGTRVQLSLTVSPIRDPQGRITGASTIARDISYRKRAEEELRRSVAYNRSLIEASLDPLVTISPEGKITDVNRATENITGCGREQLIGSDFCDYFTDPEKARIGYQQVFREGSVQDYELEIRCGSGKTKPVLYNASVYRDETGEIGGIFAAARDITARKRAEQALEEKARDLARSNADLEQFAYVASHDLQEPLRMVANFTQLLAERYRTQLGAEGAEFVAYAVDGATRMQTLIQDLLMYSRVGTRGKSFEPTDCNEILGQAVANLQVAIRETGALVSHSELPVIRADASQFLQLLQNLIGNAIKFRGESTPQVHVSAGRQGVFWQFSVRDNGIGIDPRFADRIFVIFQRLHSRGEYPGTGIGLALCKKIVERHGGRIWVESEPGKGSTFNFTLLAP